MKIKNQTTKRIYEIINDDLVKNENGSTITTAQVWKILGTHISINSVRDKIQDLIRDGYFNAQYEFFENNKYYNRKIYPGTVQG